MNVIQNSIGSRLPRPLVIAIVGAIGLGGLLLLCGQLLLAQQPARISSVAYALRHVSAEGIEPQLRSVLSSVPGEPTVVVDRQQNRLLVTGSSEAHRLAEQLITALDRPEVPASVPARNPIQPVLKTYAVGPQHIDRFMEDVQRQYPQSSGVRLVPDARTGQLLVVAPPQVHGMIAQQLNRVDGGEQQRQQIPPASATAPASDPEPPRNTTRLSHISARELETGLEDLVGQQLQILTSRDNQQAIMVLPDSGGKNVQMQLELNSRTVRVDAPQKTARAWINIVEALDSPRPTPDHETKLVSLRHAQRANIQLAIGYLRNRGSVVIDDQAVAMRRANGDVRNALSRDNRMAMNLQPPGQEPRGSAQPQPNDADQAEGQDQSEQPRRPGGAQLVPLVDDAAAQGGLIGDVQVEFIPGTDVIVIRGNKRDVARVMELIQQIEQYSIETEPDIRLVPLEYVDSQSMGTLIDQLYEEIYSLRLGPISITALGKPNALLLIGRKETVDVVEGLIKRLDQPVEPETQFRTFPLKNITAANAQAIIQEFFDNAAAPAAEGGRGGLGTKARVSADARSNTLIVQASPRDMLEVERLIADLDVETSQVVNRVEIFQLRNSRAEDLAPILQQAISGQTTAGGGGGGGGGGQQGPLPGQIVPGAQGGGGGAQAGRAASQARSAMLTFTTVGPEGETVLRSGIMSDVRVSADPATNSLIVTGPEQAMGLIAALIRRLDQLPSSEATIKVFTLVNGDATGLRDTLEQLFPPQTDQNQPILQTAAGSTEGSLVPLRFTVDARTNSIIASGSAADLNVVYAIILKLDGSDVRQRKNLVYRLSFTQANDVALAIQDFLNREQLRTQQQIQQFTQGVQGALSPFEQIEREVVVVAETLSNSLIISATPRFFDQIVEIIEDIDSIPPQVMVQVLIADITYNEAAQFGVELGIQDSLLFDRGSVLGNPDQINQGDITSGENVAGQGLTDLSLGRMSSEFGFGGLVLAAGSESVNVLVRAMQRRGRLDLLADPKVMALNNQPARIQVGQDVRIASGTEVTVNGFVNLTTEAASVGVILEIQPRISADGTVSLFVNATRSRLGPEADGTPIGIDNFGNVIRSPRIELTTAQTTISVRSGQTAVFGGLVSRDEILLSHGVPVLSDLPILGNLFRFDSADEEVHELVIIMTPHVIRTDEDLARLTAMETSRMSWCLADVIQMHGDPSLAGGHGLWHSSQIPTTYPDGEPIDSTAPSPSDRRPAPGALPAPQTDGPPLSSTGTKSRIRGLGWLNRVAGARAAKRGDGDVAVRADQSVVTKAHEPTVEDDDRQIDSGAVEPVNFQGPPRIENRRDADVNVQPVRLPSVR